VGGEIRTRAGDTAGYFQEKANNAGAKAKRSHFSLTRTIRTRNKGRRRGQLCGGQQHRKEEGGKRGERT